MESKTTSDHQLDCLNAAIENADTCISSVTKVALKLSQSGLPDDVKRRLTQLAANCTAMNEATVNSTEEKSKLVNEFLLLMKSLNATDDTLSCEKNDRFSDLKTTIEAHLGVFFEAANNQIYALLEDDRDINTIEHNERYKKSGVAELFDYKVFEERNIDLMLQGSPWALKKAQSMKAYLIVTPEMIKKLEQVNIQFPNFQEPTNYLIQKVRIALMTGRPLMTEPMLLNSEPGLGKTAYIKAVTDALQTDSFVIHMGTIVGAFELCGASPQWRDAAPGKFAKIMLFESKNATPIIVLEELCRMKDGENHSPLHTLYPLLENETSTAYVDHFFNMTFDISSSIIIATANSPSLIEDAIKSRLKIFEIAPPSQDQMRVVVPNIYRASLEHEGLLEHFTSSLDEKIQTALLEYTPREAKQIISAAIAKASHRLDSQRRVTLEITDLCTIQHEHRAQKRSIGF